MAKVKVMKSCLVPPEFPTPSSPIWLSNLDLFAPPLHVRAVYFFRRNRTINPSTLPSPSAIKASLARTLVPYYPFAGRFGRAPDGRREIKCTAEGAYFAEAVSDLSLEEFGVYTPSLENRRLLVPTDGFDTLEKDDDSIPILLVQLTFFKCGGLCLGIALHHQAADGVSALRFTCDWAASTLDPSRPIDTPCFNHEPLCARSPPSVQFRHPEFDIRQRPLEMKPVSFAYLHLTATQIAALKASCGGRHTSYEAVASHIWRCACLARGPAQPDEEIRLVMTGDVRRRVDPPLGEEYIGNAILPTVAEATVGEVATGWPVGKIRAAISKLGNDYVRSAVDFLELQDDKRRLTRCAGNFAATDISVTSWMTLPGNKVDFGWGPPVFMGTAASSYTRQFILVLNPEGGLMVGFSLETENMERFVKLFNELLPETEDGRGLGVGTKPLANGSELISP